MLLGVSTFTPAWAVYKCVDAHGKLGYQQQPCEGRGGELVVPAAAAPAVSPPVKSVVPPASAVPPNHPATPAKSVEPRDPNPVEAVVPVMPPTALDREAEQCLSFYRGLMIDPGGAYFSNPSMRGDVLTMKIYMRGYYGGFTPMNAACEFRGTQIDDGWTQIHARRNGWVLDLVQPRK